MDIKQTQKADFIVLEVEGDIDLNSSPQLRAAFASIAKQPGAKVMVDFSRVNYVDSSGLATFIEIMQRLKKNDGALVLVGMSEKIKNLFIVTKLDKLFRIYSNQDEALAS